VTVWRLFLDGLRHYRRTHVGVVLGAAVAAAVLVGALVVGDSVRGTLRRQALLRVGQAELVLSSQDRFFRTALAEGIKQSLRDEAPGVEVAPALMLSGIATRTDATARAGGVQVLGVDSRFFALSAAATDAPLAPGEVLLNGRLATQLGVEAGATILIRVEQPSAMPRDLVLATTDDLALALRCEVKGVVSDEQFGRFALAANQVAPFNAFVAIDWLQEQLDLTGRANLMLAGGAPVTTAQADAALAAAWTLTDGELELRPLDGGGTELRSRRIFIDAPVADALGANEEVLGVLTYFVNNLQSGERITPYSMVTAIGDPAGRRNAAAVDPRWAGVLPDDLGADEIVINEWLAEDLEVGPGDAVELAYFVPGPGRRLDRASARFTVRAVIDLQGPAADQTLMPDFPGLADAEHCRDWEPGIPIDLEKVRDKDEAYWDEHRGTPKAFVRLDAGQRLWSNRFGSLTAARLAADIATLETRLRREIEPGRIGLFFQDMRGTALAAGTTATDFGGLFLGLSIFLIVAALLLTAMLFVFGVEQRAAEIGTLLAVGFPPARVGRLLLAEALVLAVAGGAIGVVLGLGYTRLVLVGLATVWRDAVGVAGIGFHLRPATVAIGCVAAVAAALVSIWLTLRRHVSRPAVQLLAGGGLSPPGRPGGRGRVAPIVAVVALLAALVIVALVGTDRGAAAAGAFFGAGTLLLIAALAATRTLMRRRAARSWSSPSARTGWTPPAAPSDVRRGPAASRSSVGRRSACCSISRRSRGGTRSGSTRRRCATSGSWPCVSATVTTPAA
jgi:ABC-type lipoprotein release transport system permease subunit